MARWSDEEKQFLRDNYSEMSAREMGIALRGRSIRSVQSMNERLGLKVSKESHSKFIKGNRPDLSGDKNPRWKGGISKNNYHYRKIQMERYPERVRARNIVNRAIRSGYLRRLPCANCGAIENIVAHHTDYRYALEIVWLCESCHREEHENLNKKH